MIVDYRQIDEWKKKHNKNKSLTKRETCDFQWHANRMIDEEQIISILKHKMNQSKNSLDGIDYLTGNNSIFVYMHSISISTLFISNEQMNELCRTNRKAKEKIEHRMEWTEWNDSIIDLYTEQKLKDEYNCNETTENHV